ncbi:MAG: 2-amino-4-hydroxy-6-hydroxymethyldihydropteridine diphosphokinase [Myxococcales bacterium]|nr:2-amino-4-hydroxy-6-hydroxymethyldihydropteridine diphosphokinase [Myxococcales bacterium]
MRVVLGLGSNLGDRLAHLRYAKAALVADPRYTVLAASPVYETPPLGPPQGDFLNAAILLSTEEPLPSVLAFALALERDRGRERRVRWGPRTLDVDILWSDGPPRNDPSLTVPHPGLSDRPFALFPLLDVLDPGEGPTGAATRHARPPVAEAEL